MHVPSHVMHHAHGHLNTAPPVMKCNGHYRYMCYCQLRGGARLMPGGTRHMLRYKSLSKYNEFMDEVAVTRQIALSLALALVLALVLLIYILMYLTLFLLNPHVSATKPPMQKE